jgi:hypothetical protein
MGNDEKTLTVRGPGDDAEPLFRVEVVIRSDDGGGISWRNYQFSGERERDREAEISFVQQAADMLVEHAEKLRSRRPRPPQ